MVRVFGLMLYSCFVVWVSWSLITAPAYAFQATNYARVVHQAEQIAFAAAQKSTIAATVGAAAAVSSPAAVAVRFVAGPAGWAALGLGIALTLAEVYYSGSDLTNIKADAGPALQILPSATIGGTHLPRAGLQSACGSPPSPGCTQALYVPNGMNISTCSTIPVPMSPNVFSGWVPQIVSWGQFPGTAEASCYDAYTFTYSGSNGAQMGSIGGYEPTAEEVGTYISGLSSGDPDSVESHTVPKGQGASPSSPATTQTVSVSPAQMPSEVVPKPVAGTDAVVADNVPPPADTPQTQTATQTSTTTTTTDGDTSEESTEATVSCNGTSHDERTLQSIWESHRALWGESGVGSLLNVFKTITWPDTLGSVSFDFSHAGFGTYVLDFNNYASAFAAGRAVMLFAATFMAYRIVFGGGG